MINYLLAGFFETLEKAGAMLPVRGLAKTKTLGQSMRQAARLAGMALETAASQSSECVRILRGAVARSLYRVRKAEGQVSALQWRQTLIKNLEA